MELIRVVGYHLHVGKIPLSLGLTLSSATGYLLFFPKMDGVLWLTLASIFLICSGGGALNNYQERRWDKHLPRTACRPLPLGLIPHHRVLIQAISSMSAGCVGLAFTRNPVGSVTGGLIGVLLYNGFYTPLKSRTTLAILPGALCGMLPPLMGWLAAGGPLDADCNATGYQPMAPILALMLIIGAWQLPHFWLILLRRSSEYTQLKSTLPSMLSLFHEDQLNRILVVWILLYGILMMMGGIRMDGIVLPIQWGIVANASMTSLYFLFAHLYLKERRFFFDFLLINSSLLTLFYLIIVNQLFFY